jgi:hypothetical protein
MSRFASRSRTPGGGHHLRGHTFELHNSTAAFSIASASVPASTSPIRVCWQRWLRLARHGRQYRPQAKEGATLFTPPGLSARLSWHRHRQIFWGGPRGDTGSAGHRTRAPDGPRVACAPSPASGGRSPTRTKRETTRSASRRNGYTVTVASHHHRKSPCLCRPHCNHAERNRMPLRPGVGAMREALAPPGRQA